MRAAGGGARRSSGAELLAGGAAHHGGTKQDKERSYQIDKQIDEDAKRLRRECKILLLGSGESGKSTIVKQMKLIYQNGYSRDEMMLFRLTIHKNIIDSAQGLVLALRRFQLEPTEEVNRVRPIFLPPLILAKVC